eukprot:c21848_g1_i1.p1 GENE.c21848_g1_i1~~c21848_g1_i1.p1  ORF type:complete len:122 (+),score=6.13 c21848_g1_i1:2-367(+)
MSTKKKIFEKSELFHQWKQSAAHVALLDKIWQATKFSKFSSEKFSDEERLQSIIHLQQHMEIEEALMLTKDGFINNSNIAFTKEEVAMIFHHFQHHLLTNMRHNQLQSGEHRLYYHFHFVL